MKHCFCLTRSQKGKIGENIAKRFLVKQGFIIKESNFHTQFGEIDIIAEKSGFTHFFEVKTVTRETVLRSGYIPEYNVSREKIGKILKTIEIYLEKREFVTRETLFEVSWQLDVICVVLHMKRKRAEVRVWENVVLS
jgi:putative endonuclease